LEFWALLAGLLRRAAAIEWRANAKTTETLPLALFSS